MGQTLICWLGRTDLRAVAESDRVGAGPIAQALKTGRFARLELICDYAEDVAAPYLDWLKSQFPTAVTPHFVSLTSPTDFGEIYRSLSKSAFVKALQKLIPELEYDDVTPAGSGVRAQALEPDGSLVDDFRIVQSEKMIHVLNAPSPAATASLSIGNTIAGMAKEQFELG